MSRGESAMTLERRQMLNDTAEKPTFHTIDGL
jgi:hypothetical protein